MKLRIKFRENIVFVAKITGNIQSGLFSNEEKIFSKSSKSWAFSQLILTFGMYFQFWYFGAVLIDFLLFEHKLNAEICDRPER